MLNTSAAYQAAIVADSRKTLIRAVVDLISPDIVYSAGTTSGATTYSDLDQLHNKVFETSGPYATLETNRWTLDGSFSVAPPSGEVGWESDTLTDANGENGTAWAQINFSGVSILQACSVYFPDADYNGVPTDFTVDVYSGGSVAHTETFTGNTESFVKLTGFAVNNPDGIRVTVTGTSLPYRRARVVEIVAGVYEIWGNDDLAGAEISNQADFAAVSTPYGTCMLVVDNSTGRFSPRNKSGLFSSLEDRQGIEMSIGVRGAEYVPAGIYYQYSGGWKSGTSGLTMTWSLVDIIGLLAPREFALPSPRPSTLEGWVSEIVSQLGTNFAGHYTLDGLTGSMAMSAGSADLSSGVTCGQLLMWVCQRACCYMRADPETGYLVLSSSLPVTGNNYTLDNLSVYPEERANNDVAAITFKFLDGTQYVVSGESASSPSTISIDNPFIQTTALADATAAWILQFYGGNAVETTGRGDPSTELGDLVTVEFDNNESETARVVYQTFAWSNGVMQGCKTRAIEVSGV